jgi:hypothetical protein
MSMILMCLKEFHTYMLIFPYKLCETIGRIYRMQLIFDSIPLTRISTETSLFHWSKESSVHKRMYYHGPYTKCNLLLLAIGGIECNPGPRPIKYPCGSCNKACRWNQKSVACDKCDQWFHSSEVVNQVRVESMFININIWTLGFLNYRCLM